MIKYVSFDLQGTLSSSKFSDYFWLEMLPKLYAKHNKIGLEEAKTYLKDYFKKIGKYDIKYYDNKYWEKELDFKTEEVLESMIIKPSFNKIIDLIDKIDLPIIIITTTTSVFVDYELGSKKDKFYKIYSCCDDFHIGGKTKEVYNRVLSDLNIKKDELLHIGDNLEMDIDNCNQAGVKAIYYDLSKEEKVIKEIEKILEV